MQCSKDMFSLFPSSSSSFPRSLLGGVAAAGRAGYAWFSQGVPARERHKLKIQVTARFKTMLMTLDDGMTVPFNVAFILAAATIGALGF